MALDIFSVDGAGLQVENYIYMYHLQEFIVLPSFVDSIQENFNIQWQQTTPLGRSAPIYSFSSAGPRTVQLTFNLHRDMMFQINKDVSDAKVALGDDYVDTLIKDLQACVLPDYDGTSKAVNPPVVAVRIGDDIFIKGVITSNLGVTWNYPILSNGKYSNMSINLTISEIDPYDARTAQQTGSYRNLNINSTLDYGNIIYSSSMSSPYPGATYENGIWSVKGATNMLPITGTGKDVYIRRDENGNPISGNSSNISTINQPEMTYFDLIDNSTYYQYPNNSTSTSSTNLIDEYGGIVGGNKAGNNYNGGIKNSPEKTLSNAQEYIEYSNGLTSNTSTPTRQILNNGVHPQRSSTNVAIGVSSSVGKGTTVDNEGFSGEIGKMNGTNIKNINGESIVKRSATGGIISVDSQVAAYDKEGQEALKRVEDAEQYGLSKQSASGESVIKTESESIENNGFESLNKYKKT